MAVAKFDFSSRAQAGRANPQASNAVGSFLQKNLSNDEIPELKSLPLAELHPYPKQEEFAVDPAKVIEMAESIRRVGLLQPLVVRLIPGVGYQILAGHTRAQASRKAGKSEVFCLVRYHCNDQDAELIFYWSNITQRDLKPSERARAYANIIQIVGEQNATRAIAENTGNSMRTVQRYRAIAGMDPGLAKLFDEGAINISHSTALAKLPGEIQAEVARQVMAKGGGKLTDRQVKLLTEKPPRDGRDVESRLFPAKGPRAAATALKLPYRQFGRFFRPGMSQKEMQAKVLAALELYEAAGKEGSGWENNG